jgi:hypothetical protein
LLRGECLCTQQHDAKTATTKTTTISRHNTNHTKPITQTKPQVTVQNVVGEAPNGTAFAITTGPAPELDATNLVVGRVVGGAGVLAALSALPRSKPRDEWFDKVRAREGGGGRCCSARGCCSSGAALVAFAADRIDLFSTSHRITLPQPSTP